MKLYEIEDKRKKMLVFRTIYILLILAMVGAFLFTFISVFTNSNFSDYVLLICLSPIIYMALLMVISIIYFIKRSDYIKILKTQFMQDALSSIMELKSYEQSATALKDLIIESKMIRYSTAVNNNDLFFATHSGTDFFHCDASATRTTGTGNHRRTVVNFRGKIIAIDTNKDFKENVYIAENKINLAKKSYHGDIRVGFFPLDNHPIDDDELNAEYTIFASSNGYANEVVTPQIISSVKKLREHTNNAFLIGFIKNQIVIMINSGVDEFEPSLDTPADKVYDRFKSDAQKVIDIVEIFSQNQ